MDEKEREEFNQKLDKMSMQDLMQILYKKLSEEPKEYNNISISEIEKEVLEDNELYSGYLKGFDVEYETHVQNTIKEIPLLSTLFKRFVEELYRPSKLYLMANKTRTKIKEELTENMNKEEINLLEQFIFCEDRILDDMLEQSFVYGYAMASELREEAIAKYSKGKTD